MGMLHGGEWNPTRESTHPDDRLTREMLQARLAVVVIVVGKRRYSAARTTTREGRKKKSKTC